MYKKCDVDAAIKQVCREIAKEKNLLENLQDDADKLETITSLIETCLLKRLEHSCTYQLYNIDAKIGYEGESFVAGSSAEDANRYIQIFKEIDRSEDKISQGYNNVSEEDRVEGTFSDTPGFVYHGIKKRKERV